MAKSRNPIFPQNISDFFELMHGHTIPIVIGKRSRNLLEHSKLPLGSL